MGRCLIACMALRGRAKGAGGARSLPRNLDTLNTDLGSTLTAARIATYRYNIKEYHTAQGGTARRACGPRAHTATHHTVTAASRTVSAHRTDHTVH